MPGKINVLNRSVSLDTVPEFEPFTGVRLWYNDDQYFFAGNETGRVMEADCLWATQDMADNILASISGFVYRPFEAATAILDPAAELGDGVNVGGVYAPLAAINTRFDSMCAADIAAPADEEIDHEYPYVTREKREMERNFRRTYSQIEKTDTEIRLMVTDEIKGVRSDLTLTADRLSASVSELDGKYSELALTVDGFTVTDATGTTRIRGSSIETDTLYVDPAHINGTLTADQIETDELHVNAANIDGTLTADQVVLTGSISWADLDSGVQNNINSAGGISASYARTLINEQLVSSPNIAGGKFWDLAQSTYLFMQSKGNWESGGYSGTLQLHVPEISSTPVFDIDFVYATGGYSYLTLSGKAGEFLRIENDTGTTKPQGNWDFSDANTDGIVPVWG